MTRVAVTGASGFVGGHTARALLAQGDEVVLVARHANRAAIDPGDHATWVTTDIDDEAALARAFTGCEAVIHCAGINVERGSQTYRMMPLTRFSLQSIREGLPRNRRFTRADLRVFHRTA